MVPEGIQGDLRATSSIKRISGALQRLLSRSQEVLIGFIGVSQTL